MTGKVLGACQLFLFITAAKRALCLLISFHDFVTFSDTACLKGTLLFHCAQHKPKQSNTNFQSHNSIIKIYRDVICVKEISLSNKRSYRDPFEVKKERNARSNQVKHHN